MSSYPVLDLLGCFLCPPTCMARELPLPLVYGEPKQGGSSEAGEMVLGGSCVLLAISLLDLFVSLFSGLSL